jgi:hypothetical protein
MKREKSCFVNEMVRDQIGLYMCVCGAKQEKGT